MAPRANRLPQVVVLGVVEVAAEVVFGAFEALFFAENLPALSDDGVPFGGAGVDAACGEGLVGHGETEEVKGLGVAVVLELKLELEEFSWRWDSAIYIRCLHLEITFSHSRTKSPPSFSFRSSINCLQSVICQLSSAQPYSFRFFVLCCWIRPSRLLAG